MPDPTPFAGVESNPGQQTGSLAVPVKSYTYSYDDLVRFFWPPIVRSIILAGGTYPIVLGAGYIGAGICAVLVRGNPTDFDRVFEVIIAAPIFAGFAGTIGILWASVVTVVTLPVVHLIAWSLKLRAGLVWLGAFSGGLVGFVAILPLTMRLPQLLNTSQGWAAVTMLLFGPGITIPLGQLGGAIGGRRAAKLAATKTEMRRALVAIGWRVEPIRSPDDEAHSPSDATQPGFRFRIVHLLWVGVWLSLLLTVIRLSGIPYEFILPMLLGGLLYQVATLWLGWLLARWLGPWWNRGRQIRST